jgi:hypothetical protein
MGPCHEPVSQDRLSTDNGLLVCPQTELIINNMNQKRFIQEITQKSTSNAGISFINKKAPVRRLFEPLKRATKKGQL